MNSLQGPAKSSGSSSRSNASATSPTSNSVERDDIPAKNQSIVTFVQFAKELGWNKDNLFPINEERIVEFISYQVKQINRGLLTLSDLELQLSFALFNYREISQYHSTLDHEDWSKILMHSSVAALLDSVSPPEASSTDVLNVKPGKRSHQKHSTKESTIMAFANMAVAKGWAPSIAAAFPISLDNTLKYLDIFLDRVAEGTFSLSTLSVNLSYLSGHHTHLGFDKWAAEVKNHRLVKDKFEKFAQLHNLTLKPFRADSESSSKLTHNPSPAASSKRSTKYIVVNNFIKLCVSNGWVPDAESVFPVSRETLNSYLDFQLDRVKNSTLALTTMRANLSYISTHHRTLGYSTWAVTIRDPVVAVKLSRDAVRHLGHNYSAAIKNYKKFASSKSWPDSSIIPINIDHFMEYADYLFFYELYDYTKISSTMNLFAEFHKAKEMESQWLVTANDPKILEKLEFIRGYRVDPVDYFVRLCLYMQWEPNQQSCFPLRQETFIHYIRHQIFRVERGLFTTKEIYLHIDKLEEYHAQNRLEWKEGIRSDIQTMLQDCSAKEISGQAVRRPSSSDIQTHVIAPTREIKKTDLVYNRQAINLPPLTPSRNYVQKDSQTAKNVADIDRQFLSAIIQNRMRTADSVFQDTKRARFEY